MRHRMVVLLSILVGGLAGAFVALAASSGSAATRSAVTVVQPVGVQTRNALASDGLSVNQIYRQDSSGVVDIVSSSEVHVAGFRFPSIPNLPGFPSVPGLNLPFGGGLGNGFSVPPTTQQTESEGAGVVYDRNGDILTDEHVVAGARSVTVTFENGRRVSAKVVGTDPSTDVAVLHVNVPASALHPIPLADSAAAQVGDPVVAIGSPFGLRETTTAGIVSAVGRSIQAPNGFTITGAIQTDTPINPGNSGGPLLDSDGRDLGLADQIESSSGSSSGVGFAVPSDTVARIANTIIAGHPVKHSYLGVGVTPTTTAGTQVASVTTGSPAANAGIRQGDVITAIDGQAVNSTEQFIEGIDAYAPGQTVVLTIRRDDHTLTSKVTLGTRPQSSPTG